MELMHQRKCLSTVTMFISFDLVNCTLYKSKHKGNWVGGVSSVLDHVMAAFVNSPIQGYRFWKMLGDEVVYTNHIETISEIADITQDVYNTVVDINRKIKTAQIGDATTAKVLGVKATVWIADISPKHLQADNIYVEYEINKGELKAEYLGTDIDGGFRIAQFTSANRVVISADLAALFLKEQALHPVFDKIHFVAYRKLKGIWNGEPYPIFMYHGDENMSFQDSITDTSNPKAAILKEYLAQVSERVVEPPYTSYEQQLLSQLYHQDSLSKEVEQLVDIVNKA